MPELTVSLGQRSYPIRIADGLLDTAAALPVAGPCLIVTDDHVGPLYAERLKLAIGRSECPIWQMPAGEPEKNLGRFAELLQAMAAHGLSRNATVLALGGGVIGDLAGFAAACYMRGIAFIQVPTSLLAMVDSSVGGKTAVDLDAGKNLVGAFHQPQAVWIDTAVLATLPDREFSAGLAEVVKYGAIADPAFFTWLEQQADALMAKDPAALSHAITHCCRQKAAVVARDETEQGERALLNFGHTFGHALEALTAYGSLVHGEAVAIGMTLAAAYSARQGLAPEPDRERLERLLSRFGLPTVLPRGVDSRQMVDRMRLDKKAVSGNLRLILWRGIGQAFIADSVDATGLHGFLEGRAAVN